MYKLVLTLLLALAPALTPAAESSFFSLNTGELKTELSDARREGKRAVMLFFEQEGCPGCLHMKKHVFPNKEVQAYYDKHFSSLAIDIYGSVPFRDLANRDLSEKGYAQAQKVRARRRSSFTTSTAARSCASSDRSRRPRTSCCWDASS